MNSRIKSRKVCSVCSALMEALEPRQLLSAAPSFVLFDNSPALIGTLPSKNFTITEDAAAHGPALQATVNWGDGSSSAATLHRTANGQIQVWAAHAYASLKPFKIQVQTTDGSATKVALNTTAQVLLNAVRGRTLNLTTGNPFAGTVSTAQRTAGLPVISTPQTALQLPAGAHFAQYAVGTAGAVATFRVDWGDGVVSDGSVVSNSGGNYNVVGDHTYASAGSFRIVVNVIIEAADGTLLHVDMINSTAHVAAPGARDPHFALPQHTQLSWSDILPTGTTVLSPTDNSGGNDGTSGGTTGSSSSVNISSGAAGGVLILNGGANGSFFNSGNAWGDGGGIILRNQTGGTSSGGVIIGTGTITLTPPTTGPIGYNPIPVFNPGSGGGILILGNTGSSTVTLSNTLTMANWKAHANGTVSANVPLPLTAPGAIMLPMMKGGTLIFDSDMTADQIVADLNLLSPTYAGTITLPMPVEGLTLPVLSSATIIAPPADPGTG